MYFFPGFTLHISRRNERSHSVPGRAWFIPFMILVNKCDNETLDEDFSVLCELFEGDCPLIHVSAFNRRNFDLLETRIIECLDIIRVYAKPPGREPDLERPLVLKKGSTIADLAPKIHRDFSEKLKSARVWVALPSMGNWFTKTIFFKTVTLSSCGFRG